MKSTKTKEMNTITKNQFKYDNNKINTINNINQMNK